MADIIAVSALNRYVRSLLESDEALMDIAIRGEVSNFTRNYKTGHCYFSLKDEKASVKAVMFRNDAERQSFLPENGMSVVARGRVSLYERDGAFQIYVEFLFPDGAGAAQMAFEQLKARLEAEGLFDVAHKQMLPAWPKCVGLVTSKTGAALQDILKVARRRNPAVTFILAPVTVQGERAAPEIAEAIRRLDAEGEAEVIIVARGGGSAEDLWVFNAEAIARAVYACETPVVSAIGHEVDFTILDFVADMRAPTPSAAAEIVLPDLGEAFAGMLYTYANITNNIQIRLRSCYNELGRAAAHPALAGAGGIIRRYSERLGTLTASIGQAQRTRMKGAARALQGSAALASGLNPYAVLARGYGIARAQGRPVKSVAAIAPGDEMELQLHDGRLGCRVETVAKEDGTNG